MCDGWLESLAGFEKQESDLQSVLYYKRGEEAIGASI